MDSAVSIVALVTVSYFSIMGHEVGHLIAATLAKMSAKRIVFGMGPEVASFTILDVNYHWRILPFNGSVLLLDDANRFRKYPLGYQLLFYSGGIIMNFFISLISYIFLIILPCTGMAATTFKFQSILEHSLDLCFLLNIILSVNLNMGLASLITPYVHFDGGKILFLLIDKYFHNYINHYLYFYMALSVSMALLVVISLAIIIVFGIHDERFSIFII